jgi:hypothetical protein
MNAIKEQSKRSKPEPISAVQSTLSFAPPNQSAFSMVEEEKMQAKINKGEQLLFYGFNSRMVPDDVNSRPVYRKLAGRTEDELKIIEQIKT